jgi:DNA-binding CsgD family transcriptional regulator
MMFAIKEAASDLLAESPLGHAPGDPMLAQAVDTLKQGLILFDATGHLLTANAAARTAIALRTDLRIAESAEPPHDRLRLYIKRAALQLKLDHAIKACAIAAEKVLAVDVSRAGPQRAQHAMILSFEHGQPGLILQLAPMPTRLPSAKPAPAVLGVLIDRSHVPCIDPGMLRHLFGLTDAESRVAEAYLRADTVKDVAALLAISTNTVKTHLAAAYLKTGCTRQAQFVRLLMTLSELSDATN